MCHLLSKLYSIKRPLSSHKNMKLGNVYIKLAKKQIKLFISHSLAVSALIYFGHSVRCTLSFLLFCHTHTLIYIIPRILIPITQIFKAVLRNRNYFLRLRFRFSLLTRYSYSYGSGSGISTSSGSA